jgi:FkbM family methyltransferase
MIVKLFKDIALNLHIQHDRLYSYYKVKESGVNVESPLDSYERNFYLSLRSVLVGDDLVVYDIGAAQGVSARCLAKLTQVASVHAFEPIPASYAKLEKVSNQFGKVICHKTALGNLTGKQTIYVNKLVNSSSLLSTTRFFDQEIEGIAIQDEIEISVVRLDDYVQELSLPQPHLIKIDVQGYEQQVIAGGLQTIRQAKYCFVEMSFQHLYDESPLFGDIYQLMVDSGFRLIGVSSPMIGKSGRHLQVDGLFANCEILD